MEGSLIIKIYKTPLKQDDTRLNCRNRGHSQMSLTFKEQIELLDGLDVWQTKPLGQMNSLLMTDGPHGIRKQIDMKDTIGAKGSVKTTCYPTASLTACSFDRNLLKKLGENIAKEAQHFGVQLVLGPGINIKRTPLCGRNFEYFF